MTSGPHLGWRKWRRLPHFDEPGQVQHVIFRLRGSIPRDIEASNSNGAVTGLEAFDAVLDQGEEPRSLADPLAAAIVAQTLQAADTERYNLLAWCVMPNHVHVLMVQKVGWPLHRVVGEWKSISARRIKPALGLDGAIWARDYFDRAMRDERQSAAAQAYIEYNPVKAGLCREPSDWKWGSAYEEVGLPAHLSS
jgi:REP element-mobilizing transposase RayT